MKLVWSDAYEVELFGHVFPITKYRLVKDALLAQGLATEEDLVAARRASGVDLVLVHTPEYVDDLINLRWTERTSRSEMALTPEIVNAYMVATGGTIAASDLALRDGISIHLGGGYHHSFPDHAEGFCYVNDVAVAISRLRRRSCIVDCDLHQGNGTAFIFSGVPEVFTFSIHQENNYPLKQRSDLDIGLPDGADDTMYLRELGVVGDILDSHKPEICFYLAGADPYEGDVLGGLALTKEGLRMRDLLVFEECRRRSIPVCVVLAGGYASRVEDVVDIHVGTVAEAKRIFA
ncbi:MAG: histone deacetylase [Candidatus Eisenbacteria bacterium]